MTWIINIPYRYALKRDTAANWASNNPVLFDGEPGIETDVTDFWGNQRFKFGNGSAAWNSRPYAVQTVMAPAFRYAVDTGSTADTDPGAGTLKFNNATQASATVIYVDDVTKDTATDLSNLFIEFGLSNDSVLLHLINAAGTFQLWKITAITDGTGYFKLTVSYVAGSGSFANGEKVQLAFLPQGSSAASGGGGGVDLTTLPIITNPINLRGCWGLYSINGNSSNSASVFNFNTAQFGQAINGGGLVTKANTNAFTRQTRYYYASAAGAGSSAVNYSTTALFWGSGGWFYGERVGNSDAATVANARCFYGVSAGLAAPGNVNPSSLVNMLGFGADSGDANMQFMHNDGSGTATKVDLGANFPANTSNVDFYEMQMLYLPASGVVKYYIKNLANGVESSGSVTTDIPADTVGLGQLDYRNNGATALAVRYDRSAVTVAYSLE